MPTAAQCAAYKVIFYIKYYTGADFYGPYKKDNSGTFYPQSDILNSIINGYPSGINRMIKGGINSDCNHCATSDCENAAKQMAVAWIKANAELVRINSGLIGPQFGPPVTQGGSQTKPKTPSPTPSGSDTDCYHYGGDFFNGVLDGVCVAGKSVLKGGGSIAQDPVARWFPLMFLGFGLIAIIMVFKGR